MKFVVLAIALGSVIGGAVVAALVLIDEADRWTWSGEPSRVPPSPPTGALGSRPHLPLPAH